MILDIRNHDVWRGQKKKKKKKFGTGVVAHWLGLHAASKGPGSDPLVRELLTWPKSLFGLFRKEKTHRTFWATQ